MQVTNNNSFELISPLPCSFKQRQQNSTRKLFFETDRLSCFFTHLDNFLLNETAYSFLETNENFRNISICKTYHELAQELRG